MRNIGTTACITCIVFGLAGCASEGGVKDALAYGKLNSVMDSTDKQKSVEAIKANQTQTWTNPGSGNKYTFTPTRTFTGDMGTCRDYRIDATVGGNSESVKGTACTGPRSFWQPTDVK
jgi:surface antigen